MVKMLERVLPLANFQIFDPNLENRKFETPQTIEI